MPVCMNRFLDVHVSCIQTSDHACNFNAYRLYYHKYKYAYIHAYMHISMHAYHKQP
jgi:hypothetical protein